MNRVKGKIAIVTGGSMGIGKACCLMLAAEGAHVAVMDVVDAEGRAVVDDIQQHGGIAEYWHLDVGDELQVQSAFAEVAKKFGGIHILVNNAGISGTDKPTHELTLDEWNQVMRVNVQGVFLCTKHAIPYLKQKGGSIINLSSIYGLIGAGDVPPYHASKGAVRLMTKNDALIYAKDNIRVNSIHPGFIWTPMVENYLKSHGEIEAGKKAVAALHPLQKIGDPDDIAYGVLYLASDESQFVTGSELVIDGGYTAR
ncbi:MAG: glucose 1-dehydrogenase [Deltaproteobacteria bacterium]|nr:glucose 1-dehydrogenase [Deltaproteobacteria bacterium]